MEELFDQCILKYIWLSKFLLLQQCAKRVPDPWVRELTIT